MFSRVFWIDALERAIKTFAQTVTGLAIVAGPIQGYELLSLNWVPILAVGGITAGLSILTSLASTLKGKKDSASLVN